MPGSASSATIIANNALSRVGSTERLVSIEDSTSNTAHRIRTMWEPLRRKMLVLHPFNFAIQRRYLNEDAEKPAFGWARQFALPEDCLRWLPAALGDRHGYVAEREGDRLLTNAVAPLPCRYIRDVEDVTLWSPAFVSGFIEGLAYGINEGVTQSAAMGQFLDDVAERAVRVAKRIDGLETGATRRSGVTVRSSWLTARNRGQYGPR